MQIKYAIVAVFVVALSAMGCSDTVCGVREVSANQACEAVSECPPCAAVCEELFGSAAGEPVCTDSQCECPCEFCGEYYDF